MILEEAPRTNPAWRSSRDCRVSQLDVEYSGLHDLQFMLLLIVLEHGLEHEVEAGRLVEDVVAVYEEGLLPGDYLKEFPDVLAPHNMNR